MLRYRGGYGQSSNVLMNFVNQLSLRDLLSRQLHCRLFLSNDTARTSTGTSHCRYFSTKQSSQSSETEAERDARARAALFAITPTAQREHMLAEVKRKRQVVEDNHVVKQRLRKAARELAQANNKRQPENSSPSHQLQQQLGKSFKKLVIFSIYVFIIIIIHI
jgi:hypothetical protein